MSTQFSSTQVQENIIHIINEVTQDWDIDTDEAITAKTQLVEDLNFASLDFIRLVVAIEDHFEEKLGFQDLLMQDGEYISDLTIGQLVTFVNQKLSTPNQDETPTVPKTITPSNTLTNGIRTTSKISSERVAKFREIIENRIAQLQSTEPSPSVLHQTITKNQPAVFILSPPRSGSTLLRVILAGHSKLFAPPELHLLSYQSLAQRRAALGGEATNHLLQGTVRGIMQLKECSPEEAETLMETCEQQNLTTQEFYGVLQQELKGKTLVDKTPTYASHLSILKRAEEYFENPLYIHLLRHPCGMIRSYEEAKLERIVPIMNEASFERLELAELTWLISQENILEFLQDIPKQRQIQIQFEDLVQSPEQTINSLCHFLGIELEEDMLEPYKEKSQRMTDGVSQASEMSGDLKFHLRKGIDSTAADSWKQYYTSDFLSDETRNIARTFNYEIND